MNTKLTTLTLAATLAAQSTFAGTLPTDHAPIGVMADHNHLAGEWMAGFRFNQMSMENKMLDGDYLNGKMMAPKTMKKEMYVTGLMYGLTDELTLVGNVPFVKTKMAMGRSMGADFQTSADGIGDVKLGGIYTLYQKDHTKVLLNMAISLPTGSINQTDDTPMMANQLLSPNMQPGSGTYDIISRLTYIDRQDDLAWGGQIMGVIRTNTNDNDYKMGDRIAASAWVGYDLANFMSVSLRLDGQKWGDTNLNGTPVMNMMGAERLDLLGGINFIIPEGTLKGNRFAIEFGKAIHQDVGTNMMENDYRLHAGWQLAF
ncbi:transporter [Pseudemcibacter aquimaris]|uniref:transporter n=1 Tax=Pseudemcibacter aquimaris TaxID=2857064 RepID=UPI002011D3B0|nr:transporter [Pseudemcibacter aquimaris]MCC3861289.1 transporter [Pseudemcibacter aquimaris]WDU58063.1 transporter [Pseudemcibacter aquimaris]